MLAFFGNHWHSQLCIHIYLLGVSPLENIYFVYNFIKKSLYTYTHIVIIYVRINLLIAISKAILFVHICGYMCKIIIIVIIISIRITIV